MHDNDETDPEVARANTRANFERLQQELPADVVAREDGLARELASLRATPARKLRILYGALGELMEAVEPFTACRPGCSACCHYNVSVYPLEARLIASWTGRARLREPLPAQDFHGQPCPFLENGRCGIYEYRPMACRKHVALTKTAHWCAPERCNDETFPLVSFSSAVEALEMIIREDGQGTSMDIRQWFGVADRA